MTQTRILQAITRHEKAAQTYLLERTRWNEERLYRRCHQAYQRIQMLWHGQGLSQSASAHEAEEVEIATYLQAIVRQEHERPRPRKRACPDPIR